MPAVASAPARAPMGIAAFEATYTCAARGGLKT